jgi:hypothetical protein
MLLLRSNGRTLTFHLVCRFVGTLLGAVPPPVNFEVFSQTLRMSWLAAIQIRNAVGILFAASRCALVTVNGLWFAHCFTPVSLNDG